MSFCQSLVNGTSTIQSLASKCQKKMGEGNLGLALKGFCQEATHVSSHSHLIG